MAVKKSAHVRTEAEETKLQIILGWNFLCYFTAQMRGFCDLVREMSSFLIMLCWSCLYGFPEMPTMHLDFLAEFDAVTLIDAVFCGS